MSEFNYFKLFEILKHKYLKKKRNEEVSNNTTKLNED